MNLKKWLSGPLNVSTSILETWIPSRIWLNRPQKQKKGSWNNLSVKAWELLGLNLNFTQSILRRRFLLKNSILMKFSKLRQLIMKLMTIWSKSKEQGKTDSTYMLIATLPPLAVLMNIALRNRQLSSSLLRVLMKALGLLKQFSTILIATQDSSPSKRPKLRMVRSMQWFLWNQLKTWEFIPKWIMIRHLNGKLCSET